MSVTFNALTLIEFTTQNIMATGNSITLFRFRNDLFQILTRGGLPKEREHLYLPNEKQGLNLALQHDDTHRARIALDGDSRLCISQMTTLIRGQTKIPTESLISLSNAHVAILDGLLHRFVTEWIKYIKDNATIAAFKTKANYAVSTDFSFAANICHLYHTYHAKIDPSGRDNFVEKESAFYSASLYHIKSASVSVIFQHLKDAVSIFGFKSGLGLTTNPIEEQDNVYTYNTENGAHAYMYYLRIKPTYLPVSCKFGIAPLIVRDVQEIDYMA